MSRARVIPAGEAMRRAAAMPLPEALDFIGWEPTAPARGITLVTATPEGLIALADALADGDDFGGAGGDE